MCWKTCSYAQPLDTHPPYRWVSVFVELKQRKIYNE
jgi:hypothetical protein